SRARGAWVYACMHVIRSKRDRLVVVGCSTDGVPSGAIACAPAALLCVLMWRVWSLGEGKGCDDHCLSGVSRYFTTGVGKPASTPSVPAISARRVAGTHPLLNGTAHVCVLRGKRAFSVTLGDTPILRVGGNCDLCRVAFREPFGHASRLYRKERVFCESWVVSIDSSVPCCCFV
ncbi:unnamed protein product, partial [Ectocarpus sp. 8 AP-2014]